MTYEQALENKQAIDYEIDNKYPSVKKYNIGKQKVDLHRSMYQIFRPLF